MMFFSSPRIWTDAATWALPVLAGACAGLGLAIMFENRLHELQAQGRDAMGKLVSRRRWRPARLQLLVRRGR